MQSFKLWNIAQRTRALRTKPALGYPLAFGLICLAVLARLAGGSLLGSFPFLTFYPPVVIAAFLCGPGPAVMTGLMGLALSVYFMFDASSTLRFEGAGLAIATGFYACTNGLIIALTTGMLKALDRQHATARRLEEREAELNAAMDVSGIASFDMDPHSLEVRPSPRLNRLFDYPPDRVLQMQDLRARYYPPDDEDYVREAEARVADPQLRFYELDFRLKMPDGKIKWINGRGEYIRDEAGKALRSRGLVMDITARKELEQTRELLLQEMDHRIKNLLAMVAAIGVQTLRGPISLEQARANLDGRLAALAGAHELLTRYQWSDMEMRQVVEMALAPHLAGGQIHIAGPDCRLKPKRGLALTLALHELATNAIKYGALSVAAGQVFVDWRIEPRDDGDRLVFTWRETGGPEVVPPSRRGFGSRIIERVLAADFAGEAKLDYCPDGLCCSLTCPAS